MACDSDIRFAVTNPTSITVAKTTVGDRGTRPMSD